jgi:hypothetical protein
MHARLGSLCAVALAALSCGTSDPARPSRTLSARSAVAPQEVYCGEVDCPWVTQPGACQEFATRLVLPGQFVDARMTGPIEIGERTLTVGTETFTVDVREGYTFDWTSTWPVSFVAASTQGPGGPDSNVYFYAPPSTGDDGLSAYGGAQPGQILFCVSAAAPPPALGVTASAHAGFTRTWSWGVLKSAAVSAVTAEIGAAVDVQYAVTVSAVPFDAGYVVTGTIAVQNAGATSATGVVITAALDGAPVTPDCGAFSGTIPAGATRTCTWSVAINAPVSGTLLVTATANGAPALTSAPATVAAVTATASAPFAFGGPTTVVDACVTVTDDRAGALGAVCAADAPRAFTYTRAIGPYAACEPSAEGYAYSNTARVAAPSGAAAYSTWTVRVRVPCKSAGCTLTQGYWKTHGRAGPAPYDPRWRNVGPLEEDTPFFRSGQTWIEVLRTPVRGSAYYALAHQYMAAKLNVLAGASAGALGDALGTAEVFLAASTPATTVSTAQRAQLLALADLLDRFNSGAIGPGHCDDPTDCRDEGGLTCHERCAAQKGHDGALHQQCLERSAAQAPKLQGLRALCVQPEPEPDLDERCFEHAQQDERIQLCVDECLRASCGETPPPPPDDGACADGKKHEACRAHDRDDRAHGCGRPVEHHECRDHARRHHGSD